MRLQKMVECGRSYLFLALDEEGDADAAALPQSRERAEVDHDSSLVVGCSAAEQAAAAFDGLVRVVLVPALRRPLRLDVVVGVEEDGGLSGRRLPVGQDRGAPCEAARGDDFDDFCVEPPQARQLGHSLGAAAHIVGVVWEVRGHRGDSHEGFQLRPRGGQIFVYATGDCI